jgi:hypothetical protein
MKRYRMIKANEIEPNSKKDIVAFKNIKPR